jgi:hypothetical protein
MFSIYSLWVLRTFYLSVAYLVLSPLTLENHLQGELPSSLLYDEIFTLKKRLISEFKIKVLKDTAVEQRYPAEP